MKKAVIFVQTLKPYITSFTVTVRDNRVMVSDGYKTRVFEGNNITFGVEGISFKVCYTSGEDFNVMIHNLNKEDVCTFDIKIVDEK